MIAKHQRVRLNDKGVSYFCGGFRRAPSARDPDWSQRVGVVHKLTLNKMRAYVMWEGTKSASDALPVTFLLPAEAARSLRAEGGS